MASTPRVSAERLRRRTDVQRLFEDGRRVPGRFVTLLVAPNGLAVSRVAVVASRKLGGAVVRNRAKRRARELFRRHKPGPGLDVVVIARPQLLTTGFASLESDFCATLRRYGAPTRG